MESLKQSFRVVERPPQLWVGLALIAIFWPLNWLLPGLRTHLLFFPLWLGYCLAVDGLVYQRRGSSLLTRNHRAYVGLFLVSAPAWWLFEVLNWRIGNWEYVGSAAFLRSHYAIMATLSFSTVIPAVLGTAELASTFSWVKRLENGPVVRPERRVLQGCFIAGWIMLAAVLLWPRIFFPFVWLSIFFILSPVNAWLGNRSVFGYMARGEWRPVVALGLGAMICGFFWEMWNYYAYPKWIYHVAPYDFAYIFEMPLLGYFGYFPFGLELFSVYHFVVGLFGQRLDEYVVVAAE